MLKYVLGIAQINIFHNQYFHLFIKIYITHLRSYNNLFQVTYHNANHHSRFGITLESNGTDTEITILVCITGDGVPQQHLRSCYSAKPVELRKNDKLSIKDKYTARNIEKHKTKTYWGVVCLSCR